MLFCRLKLSYIRFRGSPIELQVRRPQATGLADDLEQLCQPVDAQKLCHAIGGIKGFNKIEIIFDILELT